MKQSPIGAAVQKLLVGIFAVCLVAVSTPAQAAPISGSFNLVGTQDVRVGASFIDWGPFVGSYAGCNPGPNAGPCAIDGTTTGTVLFTSGSGSFAGIGGTGGTLLDLEDDFAPVNTAISVENFLTMAAQPGYDFTLTFIPLGTGSAAECTNDAGDTCTPPGSPFTITNLASGSSVAFNVRGTLENGGDVVSTWVGRFSTQLPVRALTALGQIAQFGFVQASQSANFEVTFIPEPATLLTFGAGTALLAAHRRRRNKKNQAAA